MQKIFRIIKVAVLFCFFFSFQNISVFAQSNQEIITSFSSVIKVNLDGSVDVDEVIKYTTGGIEKHGIYRDIRPFSSTGGKMKITNISVTDENNNSHTFVTSTVGGDLRIKIGEATRTFSGPETYHIKYRASNAVAHLQDFDEIYWNVTGNEWLFSIATVEVKVILPEDLVQQQNACYLGFSGSKDKCDEAKEETLGTYTFTSPRVLSSGEGITVAVGFSKGIIAPYKESFMDVYGAMIGAISLVLAVFALMFTYWFKNWRDPKGTGIIVPQYDVPEGLTPMEVDAIVNERIDASSISAEIIYLATKGYIKIKNLNKERDVSNILYLRYELIKIKNISDGENEFDKKIFDSIFTNGKEIIKLSDLSNHFYKKIGDIFGLFSHRLLTKMYYKNLGKLYVHFDSKSAPVILVLCFMFCSLFLFILSHFINLFLLLWIFLSSLLVGIFFYYFSPVKTEKGVALKEYLLGLKMYLQIAEKDRLLFHNAPEKNPEIFEKLLPYAMVLGVEKAWAKEFEGMYIEQPSWYEEGNNSHFSTSTLTNSLSSFSSRSSLDLTSHPSRSSGSGSGNGSSSSGSSGGGSSGGGGGGGGGGSW